MSGPDSSSVEENGQLPAMRRDEPLDARSTSAMAAETEIALRVALEDAKRSTVATQTILERVPHAVFSLDRNWSVTFANEKAERVLRSSCSGLLKQNFWLACAHISGSELEYQLRRAMSAPGGTKFEGFLGFSNCWYEASAEPSAEGLTVFFKDVSSKHLADDALLESERRYRFVFDEGLTCNIVTSPDGSVFACNQTFVTTYGFPSKEDAMSTHVGTLWRDLSKRAEMLQQLRTRGRFGPVEIQTNRLDGAPISVMFTAVARFEKGVLAEVHSCMLDITDQKKLEAQFRQSQKMEAVGQLAGGMAHDFNNLLTVIKAYVQLALGELEDQAPLRADIKVIGDAADRAAELTRQLLAFSRQQVLLPQRINLRTIVAGIEPMIRALLGPEVLLVDDLDRPVPDIEADRSQLEQVLMNLAVNARDAMSSGGTITLATGEAVVTPLTAAAHDGAPPGSYVTLSVNDTGTGMSQETVAQIFEPFFTTKGPGKGTGLGLSTVYGIVHQSGGHVQVESVVDGGTTFTIFLPAAPSLAPKIARISGGDRTGVRSTQAMVRPR